MSRSFFAFPPRPRAAFTLIELLTVIAIIGVLAGILIPLTAKSRASAQLATCTSNLRQVGVAINLYANDNRGFLPGPLYTGQGPRFRTTDVGSLAQKLDPYLPSSKPTTGGAKMQECLKCPAWENQTRDVTNASYQVNVSPAGWSLAPFGRIDNGTQSSPPMRLSQVNAYNVARTYLMIDVDTEWVNQAGSPPSWANKIPEKPVHGGVRNVLYYDLHVASQSVTANP